MAKAKHDKTDTVKGTATPIKRPTITTHSDYDTGFTDKMQDAIYGYFATLAVQNEKANGGHPAKLAEELETAKRDIQAYCEQVAVVVALESGYRLHG